MTILDTALKTVEVIGLRDRTPYERARASYNNLTSRAEALREFLPSMPTMPALPSMPAMPSSAIVERPADWSGVVAGTVVGIIVGFSLGMLLKERVTPALQTARQQARKAVAAVQEQLPNARVNITRMDEKPADVKAKSDKE
jgi:hypothetical protein